MRTLFALSLMALAASAAQATPIRYDFTITMNSVQGAQPGTSTADGFGYVVFDTDLALGQTGTVGDYHTPLPTIDLSFDWLGMHFDATTGTLGVLYLDGSGGITGWSIDGFPAAGSCSFQCVTWGSTDFNILANGNGSGSGIALLTQQGINGVAIGNVSWSTGQVSVPEPGTLGLMALAFSGVALRRRRRKQV